MSINHTTLVGRLSRPPELKATPSGSSVLEIGLAVNDRVKDPTTGEWGERPNFFDLRVWGRRADALAGILNVGDKVAVEGRLRWVSWDTEAGKRSRVLVIVDELELMGQAPANASSSSPPRPATPPTSPGPGAYDPGPPPFDRHDDGFPPDDDIPF